MRIRMRHRRSPQDPRTKQRKKKKRKLDESASGFGQPVWEKLKNLVWPNAFFPLNFVETGKISRHLNMLSSAERIIVINEIGKMYSNAAPSRFWLRLLLGLSVFHMHHVNLFLESKEKDPVAFVKRNIGMEDEIQALIGAWSNCFLFQEPLVWGELRINNLALTSSACSLICFLLAFPLDHPLFWANQCGLTSLVANQTSSVIHRIALAHKKR